MRKIAFFVEGATERVFVEKLVEEYAGKNRLHVVSQKSSGGKKVPKRIELVNEEEGTDVKYYVLIVDCGSDTRVLSEIRDQINGLSATYHAIIGLRDVYPEPKSQIPMIKRSVTRILSTLPFPAKIYFAVLEIETWFIGEDSHYPRIDPALNAQMILNRLGIDIKSDKLEDLEEPAAKLDSIYKLVGKRYLKKKKRSQIQRTVHALGYEELFMEVRNRIPHLNDFLSEIENFFQTSTE